MYRLWQKGQTHGLLGSAVLILDRLQRVRKGSFVLPKNFLKIFENYLLLGFWHGIIAAVETRLALCFGRLRMVFEEFEKFVKFLKFF